MRKGFVLDLAFLLIFWGVLVAHAALAYVGALPVGFALLIALVLFGFSLARMLSYGRPPES